jgi:hypothetical protein
MLSETEIFATKPFVCLTNLNLVTLISYYELVGSARFSNTTVMNISRYERNACEVYESDLYFFFDTSEF